jgi:MFS family permease
MSSAGAVATFVFSLVWGRLSDLSGIRKRYLFFFFLVLSPVLLALSITNSVLLLILLNVTLACIASGIAPIAIMYTVECCRGKNWHGGVARYNSIASVGNILGLMMCTAVAGFFPTHWLFSISAALCLAAALLLWKMGKEPDVTLERHHFHMRSFHDVEKVFSHRPVVHHLDLGRLRLPRNLRRLTPLQLLFLASFVHWTGVSLFSVGQTPLMRALRLSDSLILAVNGAAGTMQAISFLWIAPRIGSNHKWLLSGVVGVRGGLMLCWATLPILFVYPVSFVFLFPLVISVVWSIFYTIIWLPITDFAISQAPEDRKGSVQGELHSTTAVASAIGSALGGVVLTLYGYTVGFAIASVIAMLAIPILARIDMSEPV